MVDTKTAAANRDEATIASFGDEWTKFTQANLDQGEVQRLFDGYFGIFPWDSLPPDAQGFDMGCGSGRWARMVAPRVGRLHCIDASHEALAIARANLASCRNASFHHATTETAPLAPASCDFGYSLGVLHHIPDTAGALADCVRLLKPGAPFLVYLYYRFDNRPLWFRALWQASNLVRRGVSALPPRAKHTATDLIAFTVYWPLARLARVLDRVGLPVASVPLSFYRNSSMTTLRTDSRDRFGTPLEQRFTRSEVEAMMRKAGLVDMRFSPAEPYWCAVGRKGTA
ncbi:class I SAM-dependent methyltransferase [Ramlibacter alkalitolerans]|uniref:Class I SAM-dependent methyltransferase n=1 Tax=Ramlibacter alkalitolerans TaxID=2039631 RepID=A0ABS1JNS6_9BURK|nr:class I SAM-dependent methyltransferase [Ramlibacter alkalitolerans]